MTVELSEELKDLYKIRVLTGTNLGMLVEANLSRGMIDDVDSLIEMVIHNGKNQISDI